MKLGMVGLPNSGKSTLFNALTGSRAAAGNYPFSTVDKNVGIVPVADARLPILQEIYAAKKLIQATIEFVDIAGLVRGSSGGGGLGNKFLSHIREMDGLVQVVRCFDDENVTHVDDSIDPARDIETIGLELIFADMETVTKRIDKVKKENKSGKGGREEIALLERLLAHLEDEKPVSDLDATADERKMLAHMGLLTNKPMIYVANVDEDGIDGNDYTAKMRDFLATIGAEDAMYIVAAKVEEELVDFDGEDQKKEFLAELGITHSGLDQVTAAGYRALSLMSFLTGGPREVRAWTIPMGTTAVAAAGKIHSDIERGFIRAEIVNYADLTEKGTYNACKDAGLVRLEGKEYIVKEGDIILFRFNV
ncbi:MAG: redox-regulated ATPase YchF [Defluviitaleaceae bacterium]|nr:redox-regulated ATPase YchF [Defluviitaleaceae bacterium]